MTTQRTYAHANTLEHTCANTYTHKSTSHTHTSTHTRAHTHRCRYSHTHAHAQTRTHVPTQVSSPFGVLIDDEISDLLDGASGVGRAIRGKLTPCYSIQNRWGMREDVHQLRDQVRQVVRYATQAAGGSVQRRRDCLTKKIDQICYHVITDNTIHVDSIVYTCKCTIKTKNNLHQY